MIFASTSACCDMNLSVPVEKAKIEQFALRECETEPDMGCICHIPNDPRRRQIDSMESVQMLGDDAER